MAIPTALDRRTALLGSLGATFGFAAVDTSVAANAPLQVQNVTGLYPVEVSRIDVPESTAAIAHYGLTAANLGLISAASKAANALKPGKLGRKPGRKVAGAINKPRTARAAKYTDGQGRTWGGMGKRPDWFKAALATGKTPEQLLVKA